MTATDKLATGAPVNVPTAGQKRVVVVGASGMVGGYALRYALDSPAVKSVTSIGRKKLGISQSEAALY
jgi:NADPH:quinone reductase-like Zn-dependent oxidoreductase